MSVIKKYKNFQNAIPATEYRLYPVKLDLSYPVLGSTDHV